VLVFRIALAIFCSVAVAACAPPQVGRIELGADEKLRISQNVWNEYLVYLNAMNSQFYQHGAFVVDESGLGSAYALCTSAGCYVDDVYARRAIRSCEEAGVKCVVFSEGDEIVVDYEIVD
jgi:hypothetical protein